MIDTAGDTVSGCSVIFSGSPVDGTGLTEEGHISGENGTVSRELSDGSYTASAICDSTDSDPATEGHISFEVAGSSVEVELIVR